MKQNDGICPFCGKMTNSLAANPGEWALIFCYGDNTGEPKSFHVRCVQDRLQERDVLDSKLKKLSLL